MINMFWYFHHYLCKGAKDRDIHPVREVGSLRNILDYNRKCRVKVEVLPHWKYLHYHGIKLTLRFHKFITCSCLYWLFMRGFIQGEIHNCSIFTGKERLIVRVGFFAYLLMANACKMCYRSKSKKVQLLFVWSHYCKCHVCIF